MDTLDQQLLALLRQDARASVATLATKLKVSRGTISNRIARMEDAGVITGYTVKLRPDTVSDEIVAWMSVTVEGNRTREVVAMLLGEPGVSGLFDTNGRWDLLAELRAGAGEATNGSTLAEVERDYILRVFRETGGVVSNTATRLGIPRTTLNAMMKRLRISRSDL